MRRSRKNERAMVLVMTVLVLSILITLGYAFSYASAVNLRAARNRRDMLRRDCELESALRYAVALLEVDAGENRFDALDERWAESDLLLEVGEGRYAVHIVDENRKLNLNHALLPPEDPEEQIDRREVLRRLILNAGGGSRDFDALTAWLDPDRPLPFIAGLAAVPDLEPKLLSFDQEALDGQVEDGEPNLGALLATHPTWININTASQELLDALWDEPELTHAVMDRRSREPFRSQREMRSFLAQYSDSDRVRKSAKTLLDVQSDFFAVSVSPLADEAAGRLTALVKRTGETAHVLNVRRTIEEEYK